MFEPSSASDVAAGGSQLSSPPSLSSAIAIADESGRRSRRRLFGPFVGPISCTARAVGQTSGTAPRRVGPSRQWIYYSRSDSNWAPGLHWFTFSSARPGWCGGHAVRPNGAQNWTGLGSRAGADRCRQWVWSVAGRMGAFHGIFTTKTTWKISNLMSIQLPKHTTQNLIEEANKKYTEWWLLEKNTHWCMTCKTGH